MFRSCLCAALAVLFSAVVVAAEPVSRAQIATLLEGHHWAAARPLIERLLEANPQDTDALHNLGIVQLNQEQDEAAVATLEKLAALAPANADYACTLGDAYGNRAQKASLFSAAGWARKCQAAYEHAVSLDPASVRAHQSLMMYCLQAPGFLGGGKDQAYAQAAAIKKIDLLQGQQAYATLYLQEKKYAEAFALFEEILQSSPDNYPVLYQVGRLAAVTGEHLDRGIACLQRCLTLPVPPDAPEHAKAHWRLGTLLEKQGDKSGARMAYEAALRLEPGFKPARESLQALR